MKELDVKHIILFFLVAYIFYNFFLKRCPFCGWRIFNCKCGIEAFTPLDTIQTSLDETINNPNCCISNTAGYFVDPVAISNESPGFSTITNYNNPCI